MRNHSDIGVRRVNSKFRLLRIADMLCLKQENKN